MILRIYLLAMVFLISIHVVYTQCPDGNITLAFEEDIEQLFKEYPNCKEIQADLSIRNGTSSSFIQDLSGLSNITLIKGSLLINNRHLMDLSGLNNLDTIGGELIIQSNNTLSSLAGLNNLKFVKEDLSIISNPELFNLEGLESIDSIEGRLIIRSSNILNSLVGLNNLKFVKEGITILNNPELLSLAGLESIDSIEGGLIIRANNALNSLAGLNNLKSIKEDLSIISNPKISSLKGLENIDLTALEVLNIYRNEELSICSFDNVCNYLSSNKEAMIYNNATRCGEKNIIRTICGVEGLCIESNIEASSQTFVDTYKELFSHCTQLSNLVISGADITDLTAFENLEIIDNNLEISNTILADISPLKGIRSLQNLHIEKNDSLVQLPSFTNLTKLNQLYISNNDTLIDLSGLNDLMTIEGSLIIQLNEQLNSLAALQNLTSVKEGISITSNPELSSLEGLENIDLSELEKLSIFRNKELSTCSFDNICDYLSTGKEATINNNATRCNEKNMILGICGVDNLCPEEKLELSSQADIDLYKELFSHCTELFGLTISGADVKDISAFENLQVINVELTISNTQLLEDFSPLAGINQLLNLSIVQNDSLSQLPSFINLIALNNLTIKNNKNLIDLSGFENLEKVNLLSITNNASLNSLSSLSGLTSVRGLFIIENDLLENFNGFSAQINSLWKLHIENNDALMNLMGLEAISSIQNLEIIDNASLNSLSALENLTELSNLEVRNNNSLSNLNNLSSKISSLDRVFIFDNDRLMNLMGLEGISSIQTLNIRGNNVLNDLSALENLTDLSMLDVRNNNSLRNLSGLEGIERLQEIIIEQNDVLENLKGIDNLTTIFAIQIGQNASLQNLSGLENLRETSIITLFSNPSLINISAIGSIENNGSIFDVTIFKNDQLSLCNVPFICDYFLNGGSGLLSGNDQGCNGIDELKTFCLEAFSELQYSVFFDLNENGVKEAEDFYFGDASLLVEPLNINLYSNSNSPTSSFLPDGTYDITLNLADISNWDITTDSQTIAVTLSPNNPIVNISFGISPKVDSTAIISTINLSETRCNETSTISLNVKNVGTIPVTGIAWLSIDTSIVSLQFIEQPDTIIQEHLIGWEFTSLFPGNSFSKEIKGIVLGPPTHSLDTPIQLNSFITLNSVEQEDSLGKFELTEIRRCSYDPNDKLIHPNRDNDLTLFEEPLTYTIRFQNTGNAEALEITILDTLDSQLDIATFKVIGSSHLENLSTSIDSEGVISFDFYEINLPDSTSDLEGSQGYITFMIEEQNGLEEGTVINNTAGIYFDKNPPIITNTTQSIFVSDLFVDNDGDGFKSNVDCNDNNPGIFPNASEIPNNNVDEDCDGEDLLSTGWETVNPNTLSIYPNPVEEVLQINQAFPSTLQVQIFGIMGQLIYQRTFSSENLLIDFNEQAAGIYLLKIKEEKTGNLFVQKIIKK